MTVWGGALGPGVTARVVLLRHGEPEATASGRCYGKLDVGLSDRGRAQVDALTPWLRDLPLRAVVASPRRRALESAERLTASWGLAVEVDPDVAELDFGAFEGLRYAEVEARYPELYARWMSDPTEVAFPGGESHAMLHARVMAAAERIRARARGGAVLVASHGGVVRTWVAGWLGMPRAHIFRLDVGHASLTIFDDYDGCPVLRTSNWRPPEASEER